jgi:hypothetical protein
MPDGTTYNGMPHVVTDEIDQIRKGDRFGGEMFPVIDGATSVVD